VDLHDDSIHYLAYPDVEPPRRAHSLVLPTDEEISFLFQQPFLPGTPRTPDRLIREAYVVHYAQMVCTLPDGECRVFDRGEAVAPDVCDGEAPL
jgi:hypothetical protein